MSRQVVRQGIGALLATLALLAVQWLPSAEAHAMLVSAYPQPGATLASTPVEIRLTFSERIGLGSTIQLFGSRFRAVPGVTSGLDPAAPDELRAFPPQLVPDVYTVEWSAVSADSHVVTGSYQFEVTAPAATGLGATWLLPAAGLAALLVLAAGGAAWMFVHRRRAQLTGMGGLVKRNG